MEEKTEQNTQEETKAEQTQPLTATPALGEIEQVRNSLPIFQYKTEIERLILENEFCVITGDTGSGKSTQLPQYIIDNMEIKTQLLERRSTFDRRLNSNSVSEAILTQTRQLSIVITQPRRVAAVSMARRICFERAEKELGEFVGYTIRFDDRTTERTRLKYVTDGILVRECIQDRDLLRYDVVVLDEAHERSLHTDVLFALVKQAVLRRGGSLKLVVTSATLDTGKFSAYFNNAPVLKMHGRSFAVQIKFGASSVHKRGEEAVDAAIRIHLHEGPGDILVFLTGSEECEVARRLCLEKLRQLQTRGRPVAKMLIYTLYGAQHSEDQGRVFEKTPEHARKLVFSTNIAETSLTIDGIGFVIDCGYVKQKCYNPRTGMDALITVPISKVQAVQRAGRAGRTQEGKCFRLYSEKFYQEEMREDTVPEVLRVNLANVLLELKVMGVRDVVNFDFMERPERSAILSALKELYFLGALDADGVLTVLGQQMCRFPLEPSYSKALISALLMRCEEEMVTVVSLLSAENVWARPPRIRAEEYALFEKTLHDFADLDGDHATLLQIYKRWQQSGYSDNFCRTHFLNSRALKMTENIKVQLRDLVHGVDFDACLQVYLASEPLYSQFYVQGEEQRRAEEEQRRVDAANTGKNRRQEKENVKKKNKQEKEEVKQHNKQPRLTRCDRFRLALASGFFYNSARKLHNTDAMYMLVYPDNNVVEVDGNSAYNVLQQWPACVVFTELGGTSAARGVMRLLSEVRQEWINALLPKLQHVDLDRLAGRDEQLLADGTLLAKQKQAHAAALQMHELERETKEQARLQKLNEAKQRFEQRKKLKENP